MDKLTLKGMRFYAYHGVFPEERKLGQLFIVDVDLYLDLAPAGESDDLHATINYAEICERIREVVETETFRLIESLAENIASRLLHNYTKVNRVTVRVTKPHPPVAVHFDGVVVEITRGRVEHVLS